ncbi:MAG: MmgE/PrpD family protein, partial [Hyphomicrobiaceae bacterium]
TRKMALDCLIDLVGTAAAGTGTPLSRIIREHALDCFGPGRTRARLMLDGREVSAAGAALANGMTIDAFDSHDGHVLTKGHAGAALLPGLLAAAENAAAPVSGREALAALAIGYEVAIRAGMALHRTVADYHTSGAWNALGVVAIAARLLGLDRETLRHGLGIAEYHGPRSQMMRCIDYPTMLKDGSGWGAMTGISAAWLARGSFTGAPAITVEVGSDARAAGVWEDLGSRWRITEQYFKPYPVCRWAQPAIRCVLELRAAHDIDPARVEAIEIRTFHEATRINSAAPASTEEAQYSLPFPVAAALLRGRLVPADILENGLRDPAVLALAARVRLIDDPEISPRYPAERLARARIRMKDGTEHRTGILPALGDPDRPLGDKGLRDKFLANAATTLDERRARDLLALCEELPAMPDIAPFIDALMRPA